MEFQQENFSPHQLWAASTFGSFNFSVRKLSMLCILLIPTSVGFLDAAHFHFCCTFPQCCQQNYRHRCCLQHLQHRMECTRCCTFPTSAAHFHPRHRFPFLLHIPTLARCCTFATSCKNHSHFWVRNLVRLAGFFSSTSGPQKSSLLGQEMSNLLIFGGLKSFRVLKMLCRKGPQRCMRFLQHRLV